jgi:Uma2 family endonuclease
MADDRSKTHLHSLRSTVYGTQGLGGCIPPPDVWKPHADLQRADGSGEVQVQHRITHGSTTLWTGVGSIQTLPPRPGGGLADNSHGSRGYPSVSKVTAADEPASSMTREEYRAWAEQQPTGRFERMNGIVVALAPERVGHNHRKFRIAQAMDAAVRSSGLPCEVYTDGITVEVGDSDCEPDAVLRCGARLSDDTIAVPDPLIIVEVLSPSTSGIDRAFKLKEYFRLPELRHYLIVWADKQQIVHHHRGDDSGIETRIVTGGEIRLDPPGITITVENIDAG